LRALADLLAAAGVRPTSRPGAAALCRAAVLEPLPGELTPELRQLGLLVRRRGRAQRRGAARAGPVGTEAPAWGRVELVAEGPPDLDPRGWGLVRLVVAPGQQIPHHHHDLMSEWELVCGAGLWGWVGEGPASPQAVGRRRCWPRGLAHGYANPSAQPAGLLCLNRPAFLPADEVPAQRVAPLHRPAHRPVHRPPSTTPSAPRPA
jgi:quercetin dioxygenase-like cupin family protein